jgi:ATP-dependent helicase/nuclease subunit A
VPGTPRSRRLRLAWPGQPRLRGVCYGQEDDRIVHTLTEEQQQAIARRREPLLLAAGAGSGKTSVLVERFVRAVCEDGYAAERILAITFTARAAAELEQRVRARLLEMGAPDAAHALERSYIGTFHSFCARLLRAHARATGLEHEQFVILDERVAARLRRRAFAAALEQFVQRGERADAVDLIAAYGADRARASVLEIFAALRSRGQLRPRLPSPWPRLQSPSSQAPASRCWSQPPASRSWSQQPASRSSLQLSTSPASSQRSASPSAAQLSLLELPPAETAATTSEPAPDPAEVDREGARVLSLWGELLELFGRHYEDGKRTRDGLDFDDLELRAGALLAADEQLRRSWAQRFELVMVDELQDVNPRQLELVLALERENLFTVGDRWQSIYGFRHADVSLFAKRQEQLSERGQSLRLEHNFRGRGELLEAVNVVFAARFGEAFTPLRAGRESAREHEARAEPLVELLLCDRSGWDAQRARAAPTARPWREAEARQLAARVAGLVGDGRAQLGEVAVLLRGTGDIECYERALGEHGLNTIASAGAFWQRQEIADVLAYLRALCDPLDEPALYGTLAGPFAGLSAGALGLLAQEARTAGEGLWEVARETAHERLTADERRRLAGLCAWLERERELAPELELAQLIERATRRWAHAFGVETVQPAERRPNGASGSPNGARRLANIRRLIELAGEWERSEGRDLRGFLDEAALRETGGGFLAGAETVAEPDAPVDGAAGEAVRLMSVHAAKGLEFDVVCVADLGRTPSTAMPDLLVDDERIGLRLIGLDDPRPRAALEYEQLAAERREAQAAEEDRIVYVAMTRARERLLLSAAVDFASWPKDRPGAAPIAWLGPALAAELPEICREVASSGAGGRTCRLTVEGTDVALACRLCVASGAPAS